MDAIIGHTGFLGSTLRKSVKEAALYNSANIHSIRDQVFDTIYCAGAPGKKWLANLKPKEDLDKIEDLIGNLSLARCNRFVLISTADIFKSPINVNENSAVDTLDLQPYGHNRHHLEQFIYNQFETRLIVRLPGLVGPGLRKNILYDLKHQNCIQNINKYSQFQFYPVDRLWMDIQTALKSNLELVHLTSEPILTAEIAENIFGIKLNHQPESTPARYDFKTLHAEIFGGSGEYTYSRHSSIQAILNYKNIPS